MPNPNEVEGALPFDTNRKEIQIAASFYPRDGSDNVSPLMLGSTSPYTITVPPGAAQFVVFPITNNLDVSDRDSFAPGSGFDLVVKGAKETYECAGMSEIFIKGNKDDVVYFRFSMLGTK